MDEPKPCILLVDDDEIFTDVMARGLSRRGFNVEIAHDAEQAVARCTQFRPSHILLDLNMPGRSGLLVLPELLALSPDARLLVLTGYSSIATAVEATKAGALSAKAAKVRIFVSRMSKLPLCPHPNDCIKGGVMEMRQK